jgi:glucose-6-phosphate isomerase
MKEVVFDKNFLLSMEIESMDLELYYMYRDVSKDDEDERKINEKGLRYDITIIPPRKLGLEFIKTAGHYHPFLRDTKITYPELYEVLEGEAHYILQKKEEEGGGEKITDVVVVKAKKGDKVLIPPNYGHVTINPSEETLKMANFVANDFSSIYEPMRRKGGAAYFELTTGEFVKNENYEEVPSIRFLKPLNIEEVGLRKEAEMYEIIKERPESLEFLTNPAEFSSLFERSLEQTFLYKRKRC